MRNTSEGMIEALDFRCLTCSGPVHLSPQSNIVYVTCSDCNKTSEMQKDLYPLIFEKAESYHPRSQADDTRESGEDVEPRFRCIFLQAFCS